MRDSSGRERRMTAHRPHLPRGQPGHVLAEVNVNKLHGMAHPASSTRIRHMDSHMTWHTSACCTCSRAPFAVSPVHIVIDTVALARLGGDNGCAKQRNHPDHQGARQSKHSHSLPMPCMVHGMHWPSMAQSPQGGRNNAQRSSGRSNDRSSRAAQQQQEQQQNSAAAAAAAAATTATAAQNGSGNGDSGATNLPTWPQQHKCRADPAIIQLHTAFGYKVNDSYNSRISAICTICDIPTNPITKKPRI